MKKQKGHFFTRLKFRNSKLRVLKENQKIQFDIKEEKDKLQAINIKKAKILARGGAVW